MSSFDKDTNQGDDQSLEIVSQCLEKHSTFQSVMQKRSINIKVVLNYIVNQGNITAALNALNMINDPTVSMDVLNSTIAKNKRLDLLNLEKVC